MFRMSCFSSGKMSARLKTNNGLLAQPSPPPSFAFYNYVTVIIQQLLHFNASTKMGRMVMLVPSRELARELEMLT